FDATLIARDAKTDVAVIKLASSEEFPTINLGDSESLMLAETVIAIGNAYGYENSVSVGVVSELHRTVQVSDDQIYYDLIQTDAAINPGNSGGPLLNIQGEMIGLNVAVRVGAQGIAFAIPVNQVMEIVAGLIAERTGGVAVHGIMGRTVSESGQTHYVVEQVVAASAANRVGLTAGDRIDSIDGQPIHNRFDFERAFLAGSGDGEFEISFTREGAKLDATMSLERQVEAIAGDDPIWDVLGVRLDSVESDDFRRLSERYSGGMLVTEVREGGPASRRGIKPNDVLVGIHIWETTSLKDIRYILSRPEVLNSSQGVSFFLLRGREEFFGNIRLSSNDESTASATATAASR
ncbi:MAG: trypsin-like peptidase domain-containing protein, partial [Planctomycetales bacterium]|nr:trypsin-like peptidase domain-containing protein [Planctomycetales bacterium]